MRTVDLTGKIFGRLKVLERAENGKNGDARWVCLCECGKTKTILASHLKRGEIRSCGCFQKEVLKQYREKHGHRHTRLYGIWAGIKRRCYNPHEKAYKYYGGRGIKVCDEWLNDFEQFNEWAFANGYNENAKRGDCTIDRINVNGDYEPSNCRWISIKAQSLNKGTNRIIEINGENKCLSEWLKITGVSSTSFYRRLNNGWNEKKALSIPTKKYTRKRQV